MGTVDALVPRVEDLTQIDPRRLGQARASVESTPPKVEPLPKMPPPIAPWPDPARCSRRACCTDGEADDAVTGQAAQVQHAMRLDADFAALCLDDFVKQAPASITRGGHAVRADGIEILRPAAHIGHDLRVGVSPGQHVRLQRLPKVHRAHLRIRSS